MFVCVVFCVVCKIYHHNKTGNSGFFLCVGLGSGCNCNKFCVAPTMIRVFV